MTKKISTVLVVNLLVLALVVPVRGHDAKGKEVTLKGEIVDLQCYMADPDLKGEDHVGCAKMCVKLGLPVGFLAEDGQLYLLMGPGHVSMKEKALELVGQQTTITGILIEQKGLKAVQLKDESGHH